MHGTFVLKGLARSSYRLNVSSLESGSLAEAIDVTVDKDVEGMRAVLARGGDIDGVVVDADGKPVANAYVAAASVRSSTGTATATTGSDGGFSIKRLAVGDYRVSGRADEPFGASMRSEETPRPAYAWMRVTLPERETASARGLYRPLRATRKTGRSRF